jgi:hypothetical protein
MLRESLEAKQVHKRNMRFHRSYTGIQATGPNNGITIIPRIVAGLLSIVREIQIFGHRYK